MSTSLALTRLQIITEGLGRAARPDLLAEGRLWLNLILDRMYLDQDFEWLLKNVDGINLAQGSPLPSDYVRMKTMTGTPARIPIKLVEADEYEWMRRGTSFNQNTTTQYAPPQIAWIDKVAMVVNFWPLPPIAPAQLLTYNIFYFYYPTLPEVADGTHDGDIPIWQLSSEILVEAIYQRALKWNDDVRYKDEKDEFKVMLDQSKMNNRDLRAGTTRFKLGKSHLRKRF